jgi:hypothetical protein
MKKVIFFLIGYCCAWNSYAQTVTIEKEEMVKVFKKINEWFKDTPSYSMTITHASYENYEAQVPYQKATGFFKKEKENYHSFIMGMHTIQNDHFKFVIDSSSKTILVANPDQLTWTNYTTDDYTVQLMNSIAIRMTTVGTYKFYRVELAENSSINAYEFLVDEDGLLKEVKWYYNQAVSKDDGPKAKPKAGISFSGYKKNISFNYKEEFSESPYFTSVTHKLQTTDQFNLYKLLDQRIRY